jgi:predicted nucleic acid-binding protein
VKLVDLNVLLYAVNRDSAHHDVIRRWWEDAINGDEPVGLAWVVLLGFLRLSTHPRVFPNPLDAGQATDRVDAWLAHGTAGNLTTDAHLASLAIAHGATLVSCDTDFGRFAKLHWKNPLSD